MINKINVALITIGAIVLGYAGMASATADSDAVSAVSAGTETLADTLKAVGLAALPLAAGVLAITFGWRFARKVVRA
jgi:uncharacterized membrane protein